MSWNGIEINDEKKSNIAYGLVVPRYDGSQIDDLAWDVQFFFGYLSDLFGNVHLRAPRDHGQVGALGEYFGFGQRYGVVSNGHILHRLTVQYFRLQKYHRIRIAYAREQQTFRLYGTARRDHFNARTMRKKCLHTLRMIQRSMTHSAARRANR